MVSAFAFGVTFSHGAGSGAQGGTFLRTSTTVRCGLMFEESRQ
jgi:hypothetical protein